MTDSRRSLERIGDRVSVPEPAYERLLERRDRKQRDERITGLVVGILVVVLVAAAVLVGRNGRTEPATNSPSPSSTVLPGPLANELVKGVDQRLDAGRYWLSRGDLFVAFDVPAGWSNLGDLAVLGPDRTFVSFWSVDQVAVDPCNWSGATRPPGTSVGSLVRVLSDQPGASPAVDVTLAGFPGRMMELDVPSDVSIDADTFRKYCDVVTSRGGDIEHVYIRWWMDDTGFRHWPHQIDRVWVLDVHGETLVVAAGSFPSTSERTKQQIQGVLESISIT
jgi:hypothetical protein